jgi:hypothetical protein
MTLQKALEAIETHQKTDDIMFDLYRNAALKSFELSLETAGKLLRKALRLYETNPKKIDSLIFNDVLGYALKHDILDQNSVERWFEYRLNRDNTAHDYGEGFANETLKILPNFLNDVISLAHKIQKIFDASR